MPGLSGLFGLSRLSGHLVDEVHLVYLVCPVGLAGAIS